MSEVPMLVADKVERDPENEALVTAQIRLGGHPLRVVLNFASEVQNLVEYVELPWLLGLHLPSQRAVVDLMTHVHAGKSLEFPVDLSDSLTHSSPPSPFRVYPFVTARLDEEADRVELEVIEILQQGFYPARFHAALNIDRKPFEIEVDLYAGADRIPVMRWIGGSQSLTPTEMHAIQRLLLRKLHVDSQ